MQYKVVWGQDTKLSAPLEDLGIQKRWFPHRRGTRLMQENLENEC